MPRWIDTPWPWPGAETAWFDGEAVVYDRPRRRVHLLDGATAAVWAMSDGATHVTAMHEELVAAGVGLLPGQVQRSLGALARAGLVVPPPGSPWDPCAAHP